MSKPTITPEMRAIAQGIAAAHPLTSAREIRATGNHLAAQNEEPEPDWKAQRESNESWYAQRELEQLVRDGKLR